MKVDVSHKQKQKKHDTDDYIWEFHKNVSLKWKSTGGLLVLSIEQTSRLPTHTT